jgi:hypothetical protein
MTQEEELHRLRRWKSEATAVIKMWEAVYEEFVPEGYQNLGEFKPHALRRWILKRGGK